jgi:hypothetical protein
MLLFRSTAAAMPMPACCRRRRRHDFSRPVCAAVTLWRYAPRLPAVCCHGFAAATPVQVWLFAASADCDFFDAFSASFPPPDYADFRFIHFSTSLSPTIFSPRFTASPPPLAIISPSPEFRC